MYYLFTVLAAVGFCLQFVFMKIYQKRAGKTLLISSLFSLGSSFVAALFFFCVNGFRLRFSPFSLYIALAWAVGLIACSILGIKAVSLGDMAVYTMFMMLGGMFLPFLFGILFLNEELSALKLVALVLLAAACVLPCLKKSAGKSRKLFYVICIAVFVLNGSISILGKVHQISSAHVPTVDFLIWANLFSFVLSSALTGALYFAARRKKRAAPSFNAGTFVSEEVNAAGTFVSEEVNAAGALNSATTDTSGIFVSQKEIAAGTIVSEEVNTVRPLDSPPADAAGAETSDSGGGRPFPRKSAVVCLVMIAAYALVCSTANMLQLIGAAHLPASVLYPIVTGGTVVLTTLAGALLFREKITVRILVATLLSFAATVLFMF